MINSLESVSDEMIARILYEKMTIINPGISKLELYEFQYALVSIKPKEGWSVFANNHIEDIQSNCFDEEFFRKITLKPMVGNKTVLDKTILYLTQKLFVSILTDDISLSWVKTQFYFDIRAFCFFIHTCYFNERILENFGNKPYLIFKPNKKDLEPMQEIGYKEFKEANLEIDQAFIRTIYQLVRIYKLPILLTLAGPTGAGKTEITERVQTFLMEKGLHITTIEMDNFYKDREYRDTQAYGKGVIHFDLFIQAMQDLLAGKSTVIPRYDFYQATSSHDISSKLRPERTPIKIEPADVIFLEGDFPFYMPELEKLITLRTVYLTDDSIRLKRKWRRDIDLRKKYDPVGFVNRYFRTQFIRAQEIYLPLMEVCDLVVDTTAAKLWLKPAIIEELQKFAVQRIKG